MKGWSLQTVEINITAGIKKLLSLTYILLWIDGLDKNIILNVQVTM